MSIETELMQIKGNKELLLAEDVEAWAKVHPKSDLHRALEWTDRKAGYEYRLWQARRLIAIHIVYGDGERRVYSLTPDRSRPGGGYRDIDDILRDKSLHDILLSDALAELHRVQLKYERLKQLKPVWKAVSRVRQGQQKGKRTKDQRRAAG